MTRDKRIEQWYGHLSRDQLLDVIERIETTDKPALAELYRVLDAQRRVVDAAREVLHREYPVPGSEVDSNLPGPPHHIRVSWRRLRNQLELLDECNEQ